ncbi:hypothetical protein FRB98_001374 [Tulasnella sp. 332]|nr:hypothetical protein FRB98_001374 [Tulasnella sp. 332]
MVSSLLFAHPRFVIFSGVNLLVIFLLLASQRTPYVFSPYPGGEVMQPGSIYADRVSDAEVVYQRSIAKRNKYIEKLGPDVTAWPKLEKEPNLYTLWDMFLPAFQCPRETARVGTLGDGGKWTCGMSRIAQQPSCIVYSVGINGESSFEAEIIETTKCEVWGYDYSVDRFGPEIEESPDLKARSHFFPYALGGKDDHGPGANPPFYTLPTLMLMNGHSFIDVLKIDIEGYEFGLMTDLIKHYEGRPLPFGQLQLEIHGWGKSFEEFLHWWQALETVGLRPFWTEPNLVYLNLFRGHAPDLSEASNALFQQETFKNNRDLMPFDLHQRTPHDFSTYSDGEVVQPGSIYADKVSEAEAVYQRFIEKRNKYIKRLGPAVIPWPELNKGYNLYTLWDMFLPAFLCPMETARVGTLGDGGKWTCGMSRIAQQPSCIVYSIGINGESSFEAEIIETTNCEVWGYDYSVNRFGPEIDEFPELKKHSHFFPYALGGKDDHGPGTNPPFYTLPTLMQMNGHTFIDILKIDIEGYEFELMTDLIKHYEGRPLPFGQLQLEIHAPGKSFEEFLRWWQALEDAGLRPFWTEPNLVYANLFRGHPPDLSEYAFLNIRGNHTVIS